ncbi:hypothetical protein [Streptosporangium saharense]|uniref:hypothetical protein n=1 Tax=Streptosporangium saharense TaxID=1706840 RepID=UPI0034196B50
MDQRIARTKRHAPAPDSPHQPWCTHHADGGHPTDQLCLHPIPTPTGTLLLSHRTDDGTLLDLTGITTELPLAQAVQLAYAILSADAMTRTAAA